MTVIAVKTAKLLNSGPISCRNRGWSSPRTKKISMTAARLNIMEKLDPSRIPVITVMGRMPGYYSEVCRGGPQGTVFDECALDQRADDN